MRIGVASIYDSNYADLGSRTIEDNCKKYCDKHGYDLHVKTEGFEIGNYMYPIHLGFEKIYFLLELLKTNKYDWLYWRGADTLITNFNTKLEYFVDNNYHFIIGLDVHGINADSFLIRNSPQGINLFETILSLKDKAPEEQFVIKHLYNTHNEIIKLMPQKFFNSYNYDLYLSEEEWNTHGVQPESIPKQDQLGYYGNWDVGDFLIHWPGLRNDIRLSEIDRLQDKIIY